METITTIVVRTPEDLILAKARIEQLRKAEPDSLEAIERGLLEFQVRAYESQRESGSAVPATPIESIRFVMERNNLRNRDLEPFIGPASRVSEVLTGKTKLTVKMIRNLHEGLGIPLESLVAEEISTRPNPIARVRRVNPIARIRAKKLD